MNFKNLAENLIIVLVSACVGGGIGYMASTYSNKQTIELLTPTITEAIKKETTSISNEFKTEIKKLKNKKDGTVVLDVEPIIENQIKQKNKLNDTTQKSEKTPVKKDGFFKRLLKGKNKN
jgi:hypothetical protein